MFLYLSLYSLPSTRPYNRWGWVIIFSCHRYFPKYHRRYAFISDSLWLECAWLNHFQILLSLHFDLILPRLVPYLLSLIYSQTSPMICFFLLYWGLVLRLLHGWESWACAVMMRQQVVSAQYWLKTLSCNWWVDFRVVDIVVCWGIISLIF